LLILLAGLAIIIPLSQKKGNDGRQHRHYADKSRPFTTTEQGILPDVGIPRTSA